MLELPDFSKKAKDFGLGPRSFSKSTKDKAKQDRSWTETPQEKAQRAAGEFKEHDDSATKNQSQDSDVLEYMASLKRDAEMEKVSKELNKKRGSDSLMDIHTKKLKQKAKEDKNKTKERRPFDRDIDLHANRFDEAQKKAMIKKSANLDGRFTSGQSKYL